ncbi:hypothetical protein AB99_3056 [Escherichia coli 1-182-04_S3_C1]|nr:hypothetical protein EC3431_4710 [Escherichia coli 3431]ESA86199.1 hypothetical protein HMPREF1620_04902 [Escherichia coli 909945-2]EZJ91810.1 hypothetical protein AB99_3056 [Escherichia coli 1-182-04_S3_C1]KDZ16273.1 hypothetical protein AC50_3279 [Escherichia coli 2-474-04_S3_C3]
MSLNKQESELFIFYICETGHLNIFPADCARTIGKRCSTLR